MVESLIAVFLTAIAIVALMPMQNNALKIMSRSDYMGRAEGILQSQLELSENIIMNSTNAVTVGGPVCQTIYASELPVGISGDASFTCCTTTIVNPGVNNSWIVYVQVTWTGNTTGIKSSIVASR